MSQQWSQAEVIMMDDHNLSVTLHIGTNVHHGENLTVTRLQRRTRNRVSWA